MVSKWFTEKKNTNSFKHFLLSKKFKNVKRNLNKWFVVLWFLMDYKESI